MKRVLVLCCLAFVVTGCGDTSAGDVAASTTLSDASTEADLIDGYVDALNQGNVEAALRLRCEEAQVENPASEELFTSQVERLVDMVGPIEVLSVGLNPSSGLEPLGDGQHVRAVHVELAAREQAGSEPLEMPGEGDFEQVFDGPPPEPPASASTSWSRAWQEGGFGGINVNASQFNSSREALDFAEQQRDTTLSDTTDVFTAGGGLGLRHLAYAWVWSQPPSVGDHIDQAILLLDDVVAIKVTVAGSQDHQRVQDLAVAVSGVEN